MSTVTAKLKNEFLAKIRSGEWKRDEQIPTESELMRDYRASRNAIRHALKMIESEGVLTAVRGSGRRVTGMLKQRRMAIGLLLRGSELGPDMLGLKVGSNGTILHEMGSEISRLGHHLVTFSINEDSASVSADDIEDLPLASMDGLIVFAHQYLLDDIVRLARLKPVIAITRDAAGASVPSFFVDFGYHAAVAVQELHARGHRKIALLCSSSPFHTWMSTETRRGYELAHKMCDLPVDEPLVFYRPLARDAGEEFYRMLRHNRPDVTAVVVYPGEPAAGMVAAAANSGKPIPQELSIVRVTDTDNEPDWGINFAHFSCPSIKMARDAVETMRKLLNGETDNQLHRPYYGSFVPGESIRTLYEGEK